MNREETISRINGILQQLQEDGFEPRTRIYSGPEGQIDLIVFDLTSMDPKVEFEAQREGEIRVSVFDNLTIAFVHLFGQSPHIQREDKKRL